MWSKSINSRSLNNTNHRRRYRRRQSRLAPTTGQAHVSGKLRARVRRRRGGKPGFIVVDPYMEWLGSLMPDAANRGWLLPKLVPQPLATYTQPIRLGNPAAATVPRVFILCTEGKGDAEEEPVVRTANRVRETTGWEYRELADTYLAPINSPQAPAEVLLSLNVAESDPRRNQVEGGPHLEDQPSRRREIAR